MSKKIQVQEKDGQWWTLIDRLEKLTDSKIINIRLVDESECEHGKTFSKRAEENGEQIIKIARKYGINELDLLKAEDELNALPKLFKPKIEKLELVKELYVNQFYRDTATRFPNFKELMNKINEIIEAL